jgi:hypothetical protein
MSSKQNFRHRIRRVQLPGMYSRKRHQMEGFQKCNLKSVKESLQWSQNNKTQPPKLTPQSGKFSHTDLCVLYSGFRSALSPFFYPPPVCHPRSCPNFEEGRHILCNAFFSIDLGSTGESARDIRIRGNCT